MKARLSKSRMAAITPGAYVDHRGFEVEVLHIAQDGATGAEVVVYRALEDNQVLTLALADFAGIVEAFGERYWRFTALREPSLFHQLAA